MTNTQTLVGSIEQCIAYLRDNCKAELSAASHEAISDAFMGGLRYPQNGQLDVGRVSVPVESLRGRGTRKYAHLVITRLDSGMYEPIAYVN